MIRLGKQGNLNLPLFVKVVILFGNVEQVKGKFLGQSSFTRRVESETQVNRAIDSGFYKGS